MSDKHLRRLPNRTTTPVAEGAYEQLIAEELSAQEGRVFDAEGLEILTESEANPTGSQPVSPEELELIRSGLARFDPDNYINHPILPTPGPEFDPKTMAVVWLHNKHGQKVSYTLIDKEFEEEVNQYRWQVDRQSFTSPYVRRTESVRYTDENGKKRTKSVTVRLHRYIKELTTLQNKKKIPKSHINGNGDGRVVHHKDSNGLNNTRANLEWKSNGDNTKKSRDKKETMAVKLICGPRDGTWSVVTFNKHSPHISYPVWERSAFDFEDEREAQYYHDRLAIELYGAEDAELFNEDLRDVFIRRDTAKHYAEAREINDIRDLHELAPSLIPHWYNPHATIKVNGSNVIHNEDLDDWKDAYLDHCLREEALTGDVSQPLDDDEIPF